MNNIFFLHPDFSLWLCLTLLHSLWIWTVIALFVFTADWFMKRVRVEKRYGFHLAALLIGLASLPLTFYYVMLRTTPIKSTVTLITAPRSTSLPTLTPAEKPGDHIFTPAVPATAPAPDIQPKETAQRLSPLPEQQSGSFISQWNWNRYLPWIAGGYLLGVSIMLFRLLRSMLQVNRLSSRAIQLTEGPLVEIVSTLASRWSLKLAPRIAETKELLVPTVVGLFRPLILLPTSMLSGLNPAELELILTHELAHIRRWDMWINLLQRLAETILFFNPGLWYVNRKINLLREFCCDEMTCNHEPCDQHTQRVNYASALLRVLELAQPQHPRAADLASLAVSGASPSEVRRRVARLFGEPLSEPFRLSRGFFWGVLTLALLSGPGIWAFQKTPGGRNSTSDESSLIFKDTQTAPAELELLTLGTYAETPQHWWNSDGRAQDSIPYQIRDTSLPRGKNQVQRQVIFRFQDLPENSSVGCEFFLPQGEGENKFPISSRATTVLNGKQQLAPDVFAYVFSVDHQAKAVNLRFRAASGSWDTKIRLPADNTYGDRGLSESGGSGETYHMQMSGPYQQQDRIVVVATHDNHDRQVRIIAVDKTGKEHRTSQSANSSISQNSYFTYRAYFKNLKLEDLDYFEFQARPYEFIEINDVPLNPVETDSTTPRKPRAKKTAERVKVSGKILLEDGSPAENQGQLCYKSPGIQGTVGTFTDRFQGRFPVGELVLTYFPDNYAPVRLDAGTLKAGAPRDDLELILKPGHQHQLNIQNEQGEPVTEATVVVHPTWGESGSGPIFPLKVNMEGALTLQHLADTSYDVNVSAPGYEPSQSKQLPVKADGTSTITLKASQKTTGRILDEAGKPVAGVTLYLKRQFGGQRPNTFTRSGRGNYWGTPLTKTDQEGRYELTEMTTDAEYLFVFEAPDGRRAIVQNLQAGRDQEFVIPDRRDLRITFSKEFLQKYSIKNASRVAIRQHVMCEPAGQIRFGELIGADVPIKVTESEGTAFFPGLAINIQSQNQPQEVSVGLQYHKGPKQVVKINPSEETRVNFTLAHAESETGQTTAPKPAPAAIEKFPVVIAQHLMLLNGRQPISWGELNTKFAELKNPSQVQPTFYITRGAMAARRMEEFLKFRSRVSRKGFQFHGFSQGSLSARADYYYDHIQTEADLQPDPADKLTGRIVDLNGKPVADAEVVLITSVPEPISYKTYEMALVQGRIRNPLEHRMTRSNSQGEFTLYPPAGEKYYIMALHPEQGFKFDSNESFASQNEIKLLHWSGLKVNLAKVPEETQTVNLSTRVDARAGLPEISINQYWSDLPAEAQKQQFAYHHIPPINQTLISRNFHNEDGSSIGLAGVSVSLLPEEVREISLGPLSKQQSQQLEWMRKRSSSQK
ncbi:M56 family metallopeptidase [Gimesia chilikensis]|uniref:Regulatory protein BlaR1 n=1 Tax=Gimesia chilikensis TaxID=2605989 RepID=A0A517PWP2_9PLAN|nr:M56 family metallopeptidase [Gimesia chilikensis]QDT23790.1 Regulatory protein BlaR1 [Gimesia chilikensis]